MNGLLRRIAVLLCLAVVAAVPALFARSGPDGGQGDFEIYVAPGTIVVHAQCTWVTIHTDVAYAAVDSASVEIDGELVDVAFTKSDDLGNFVAKIYFQDVVAVVPDDASSATVTLDLDLDEDVNLVASETVRVVQ